jgi:ABC-type transport system involved in Fe-S cluster assembly fused permease/ATPase subunit
MLQVLDLDVAKVDLNVAKIDLDIAYVAIAIHTCFKQMFQVFHLFLVVCYECFQLDVSKVDIEKHML